MKKYLEVLKRCSLFDRIEDEQLIKMLTCFGAKVEIFDKKYTVFAEGSAAKYIGIVLSGAVQMIQVDYYGNRSILAEIREAEIFAEAFACAEVDELPISVVASEPSVLMFIDCSHILHTCSNACGFHHQIIFNLMRELALKTIAFHQRIDITSKRTTREKVMAYLMIQEKIKGDNSFDIPFDRQELADYLEVDRSGLSAELGKMKKEGIINFSKNHFELL